MKIVELNPTGNFEPWQPCKLSELKNGKLSVSLGNQLLFENDSYKLWTINLNPGERLPFRMQNSNYSWACLTGGLAISRLANGCIKFFNLELVIQGILILKGKNLFQISRILEGML